MYVKTPMLIVENVIGYLGVINLWINLGLTGASLSVHATFTGDLREVEERQSETVLGFILVYKVC